MVRLVNTKTSLDRTSSKTSGNSGTKNMRLPFGCRNSTYSYVGVLGVLERQVPVGEAGCDEATSTEEA